MPAPTPAKPTPAPAAPAACMEVKENEHASIGCPAGQKISKVEFASFGTPHGSCTTGFTPDPTCNSNHSTAVVSAACIGKNSCDIVASCSEFKERLTNPDAFCWTVAKSLAVKVTCSADDAPAPAAASRGAVVVDKIQDPARAIQLSDGSWYVAVGCEVKGAKYAAICLFRALDEALSKFEPAGGNDSGGVFFEIPMTYGAIDGNGVFHNKSYPLSGLDVGCPDLFPCGDNQYCLLVTYGGPPGGPLSHMQDQWWVGNIVGSASAGLKFVPEETGLLDYGNYFAGKTGTVENQTAHGRRVLFGFPGWTQTTKPKGSPKCLQFARELSVVGNRLALAPIPELSLLRRKQTQTSCTACDNRTALATGAQLEVRLMCPGATSGTVGVDVLATPDGSQFTRVAYDFHAQQLVVDQRACCTATPGNGVVQTAPLQLADGEGVDLAVFVDGYLLEVFLNNRSVITALVAPNATAAGPAERRAAVHYGGAAATKCAAWSWQLAL
eukprot:g2630.t1